MNSVLMVDGPLITVQSAFNLVTSQGTVNWLSATPWYLPMSQPHRSLLTPTVLTKDSLSSIVHTNFEEVLGSDCIKNKRVGNPVSREIERILEKVIKRAKALNPESLCIQTGKLVWKVCVDLHILNHKGNLVDAGMLAAVLALLHFRLPVTKVMPNREVQTLTITKALSMHFLPICVTFGFLDTGNLVLLDPSLKEESVLDGKIIVCMNIYGDILTLQKTGGACVGTDILMKCLEVAKIKAKDLTDVVREALRRHRALKTRSTKEETANVTAAERLISGI